MKKNITDHSVLETLQRVGIAATTQRLAVLKILQQAAQPISINDLLEKLDAETRINKVTVYRIMSLLKKRASSVIFQQPVARSFSRWQLPIIRCIRISAVKTAVCSIVSRR